MEPDAGSDDSTEDSEDDVEASPEDMEAIMTLESSLQTTPQSYELHAQAIAPLRCPRPPLPETRAPASTGPRAVQQATPIAPQAAAEHGSCRSMSPSCESAD